jgi:sugar lactone lactonase YvrE
MLSSAARLLLLAVPGVAAACGGGPACETTCGEGLTCEPDGTDCVEPAQITACAELADGLPCDADGISPGVCVGGVCDPAPTRVSAPFGAAAHADGRVFVADQQNRRVLEVAPGGDVRVLLTNDDPLALGLPDAVTVSADGTRLLVVDLEPSRLLAIDLATLAADVVAGTGQQGFNGDGDAAEVQFQFPAGVAAARSGDLYLSDFGNQRIRQITPAGAVTTIAGPGTPGELGDGGDAIDAALSNVNDVALDASGRLYLADSEHHRIRRIDTDGTITTIAGSGNPGFLGDGGPAVNARLNYPMGVAVDTAGRVYIADADNRRVRLVERDGTISTIAGTGTAGTTAAGDALTARLTRPTDVELEASGDLLIVDAVGQRVLRLDLGAGTLSTVVGTGAPGL